MQQLYRNPGAPAYATVREGRQPPLDWERMTLALGAVQRKPGAADFHAAENRKKKKLRSSRALHCNYGRVAGP